VINDLDETIKYMIIDGVPLDINEIDVIFEAPTEEWSTSLARPTINCYLYHVVENYDLRQTDWQLNRPMPGQRQQNGAPNTPNNHTASRRRLPFRLDAFYAITVWANEVEDEHRLLWRVLAALIRFNNNPIPQEKLKGELAKQEWPVPIKIAQQESPIKNPSDFWSSMEVPIKPSITLSVTLPLDPDMVVTAPLVLTRRLRVYEEMNNREKFELPAVQFGGWVLAGEGAEAQPVPEADVVIVERGLRTKTDQEGRFKFDHVPNGRYTLRAIAASGQAERGIELPGEGYDLVLSTSRPARKEDGTRASGGDEPSEGRQDGKGRRR
jgi:hypothetical protein